MEIRDKNCELCTLSLNCKTVCNMYNSPENEKSIFIVGDFPAYSDDVNGTVMQSNREVYLMGILDKVIKADIRDVHFTYLVKCRPDDNNNPDKYSAEQCMKYLELEVAKYKPKVLLIMGEYCIKNILGKSSVNSIRGQIQELEIGGIKVEVMPTYSPAFIERNEGALKKFASDIQIAYHKSIDFQSDIKSSSTVIVNTLDLLEELVEYVKTTSMCVFDFETTSLDIYSDEFEATGIAISFQVGSSYFIPLYHNERCFSNEEIDFIFKTLYEEIFSNNSIRKAAHNLKFDLAVCRKYGMKLFRGRYDDTMLMHHLIDENKPHGLKEIVTEYFPQFSGYDEEVKKYKWEQVPLRVLAPYAGTDADMTHRLVILFEKLMIEDIKTYRIYRNITMSANKALFEMENRGMLIDRTHLEKGVEECEKVEEELTSKMMKINKVKAFIQAEKELKVIEAINTLKRQIKELEENPTKTSERIIQNRKKKIEDLKLGNVLVYEGLNLGSPTQLGRLLYQPHGFNFKMPYSREKRGPAPLTGEDYIKEFKDNTGFIENLILLRSISKLKSTYMEGILKRLDKNNYVHTSFLLHGTVTGRLSSRDPNLQNLPNTAKLKNELQIKLVGMVKESFIVPENYYLVQYDFSQFEIRVIGEFAKDKEIIRAYQNNEDLHKVTGAKLAGVTLEEFKELPPDVQKRHRTNAKPANFGLLYGQSAEGFQEYAKNNYGLELTLPEAQRIRKQFFALYRQLPVYHETYISKAEKFGYVRTFYGRKRRLIDINSSISRIKAEAERQAINSPIQGTAGEMTIFCIALLQHRLDPKVFIENTIHDSILFYIPKDEKLFHNQMEIIKNTCENLPNLEYFKKEMENIPIKVDAEYSDINWKNLKEYNKE